MEEFVFGTETYIEAVVSHVKDMEITFLLTPANDVFNHHQVLVSWADVCCVPEEMVMAYFEYCN